MDVDAKRPFLVQDEGARNAPQPTTDRAHPTEQVDGLGGVIEEEFYGDQIEDDPEGPRDAVFGATCPPTVVGHHHLGDPRALLSGISGDETMHLPVQVDALQQTRAIDLQHAAIIIEMHTGDKGDELIRDPRRYPAREQRVLARLAPTADDVIALRQ